MKDAGGSLSPFVYTDDFPRYQGGDPPSVPSTGASECMLAHLTDSIEFLTDFHSLSKIKVNFSIPRWRSWLNLFNFGQSNYKGTAFGLNEDVLGGIIKGGISHFIALEISRGNSRENRAIGRYLPWLYNTLSSLQQG